ncbi:MAG: type II secretion system protein GspM [Gemmatimonadota bacterium]
MFELPRSPRERRTVFLALVLSATALIGGFGVWPSAQRWSAREQLIAAESDRLARLRGLITHQSRMADAIRARAGTHDSGQRLLAGRTPALAASMLQSTLQDFANQSRVTVSRLDVAGAPETADRALPMIPATVSALGDIYGITELLTRIQNGPLLLEITELTVRPNPALKGELLQMTVALRGAYLGGSAP